MSISETFSSPPLRKRLVRSALAEIDFRLAVQEDAPALALLMEQFFNEAGYKDRGIVYSVERAEAWLAGVITRGAVPHIIAIKHRKIVGAISYSLDDTFCAEPVAILNTIYVVPGERRSALGRLLVTLASDLAKQDGACAFHAILASGMIEQKTLTNLFAREDFDRIGVVMGRRL
jgi:L-amino acid N-acyltransferase YncA